MQDPSLYSQIKAQVQQQQQQPQFPEQEHLKCPRCDSSNTKFCYYNNYNLSQPRHFCKNCRRYWTKGGALRNIPVGGGSRKNSKRGSSSASAASTTKRPASATAAPPPPTSGVKDESRGGNGEMPEPSPMKGESFAGQFGNLLEAGSSFGSLLGPTGGHFGNFLDGLGGAGGPGLPLTDHFGDPGSGQNVDPRVLEGDVSNNGDGFLSTLADPPWSKGVQLHPQKKKIYYIYMLRHCLSIHGGDGGSSGGGGDGGCWGSSGNGNGWPDLAIYTPGSTFL